MYTIIGYGNIGRLYTKVFDDLNLQYNVCENKKIDTLETQYFNYKDKKLLESELIFINTPPSSHLEIADYFLNKGKSVVIEKPAVTSYDELALLKRQPDRYYLAYHTKFNPILRYVMPFIKSNKITSIEVTYSENVFDYHPIGNWVFDKKISGGGCIIDSGINILSLLSKFGVNTKIDDCKVLKYIKDVESQVEINGSTDKNIDIKINMNWLSERETRLFKIYFHDKTYIEFDLANNYININNVVYKISNKNKVDQKAEYHYMHCDIVDYFRNRNTKSQINRFECLESVFESYIKINQSIYVSERTK